MYKVILGHTQLNARGIIQDNLEYVVLSKVYLSSYYLRINYYCVEVMHIERCSCAVEITMISP